MKVPPQLSEFLPAYIAEVDELLVNARAQLLAIEQAAREGSAQPRAVRELFRAVHTIKGLSAMVDAEGIVALSHLMETTLRTADRTGGRVEPAALEPLLQGLALIGKLVSALAESRPMPAVPPALIDALEALVGAPRPSPRTAPPSLPPLGLDPALLPKLSASEREQLRQAVHAGQRAMQVDFAPTPEKAAAGLSINALRQRLSEIAEIVKIIPVSRPVGPQTPGGLVFTLLLVTSNGPAEIAEAAGCEPAEVHTLALEDTPAEAAPSEEPGELEAEASLGAGRHGLVRVNATRLDEAMENLGALVVNRARLLRESQALASKGATTRELQQVLGETARLLRDLRATIVRMRMVRLADVLEPLALMVLGLRRTTGKQAALKLQVDAAELDKSVADQLFPAVVHLIRNAVDHAIEPPDERERLGKPREGEVVVECHPRSDSWLELVIRDDGAGIDAAAVAAKAGVSVPRSDEALLALLARPGLSTKGAVTTTSGRGMGMDIAKRIVTDQLGGELRLQTERGRGTTFTLRVPLTLSIVDALIFECGSQRFAAPVSAVEELLEIHPGDVTRLPSSPESEGGARRLQHVAMLNRRGVAVPLVALAEQLRAGPGGGRKAMVVQERGQPFALAVDRLMTQQEIVVRPLEDPLVRVPGVAGTTDLGDGRPTLVLDLLALIRAVPGAGSARVTR